MKEGQQYPQQQYKYQQQLPIVLLTILSSIGLLLSCYAIYVDYKIHIKQHTTGSTNENNEDELDDFVALCDIKSIGASCSKVFQLPVGKLISYLNIVPIGHMLDIPNAAIGIVFYIYQLVYFQIIVVQVQVQVQVHSSSSSESFTSNNNNIVLLLFWKRLTMIITIIATSASLFLAYHLTFIVYDLCILCWTTHIINGILFYYNVIQYCFYNKQQLVTTTTTTTTTTAAAVVVPKIKRV